MVIEELSRGFGLVIEYGRGIVGADARPNGREHRVRDG
jgi:hypothetical protein